MTEDQRSQLQREVQRQMGLCMLRLQQYEHLMKSVLAHHEVAGPVDTFEAQRAARAEKLADKSLGTLVKALFETYAVADGFERELLPADKTPTDRVTMAFSHRLMMEPQRLAETKAAVEELVAMRNELVHHLIDRLDLWSDDGCAAALRHLEHCYGLIDRHHRELMDWARSMDQARAATASFVHSGAFHDMVVNGIAPDGSFDWPTIGIVSALRQAVAELAEGGWARLDRVREWIETAYPEQAPATYGCRTWPQVVSESRLFDLEYRLGDDGRKMAWLRARGEA